MDLYKQESLLFKKEIDDMSEFNKRRLYLHYTHVQFNLYHHLYYRDEVKEPHGWGTPDYPGVHYQVYRLCKEYKDKLISYDDFIDESNYKVVVRGKDWKLQGFATNEIVILSGIYDWYKKFKHIL